MLELKDIHTYYGESHILQGVNMEIPKGAVVALLGRNGMGKTTTIHTIIGFTPPRNGKIIYQGTDVAGMPPFKIAQRGIALVPQGKRIFTSLSVEENMMLSQNKKNPEKPGYPLEKLYELFPVLQRKSSHKGSQLSGGEQQMLSFARALSTNPQLILMDEPFEGLAPGIVKELSRCIILLKDAGLSVLLVEQNIHAALNIADYAYIMSKGKVAYSAPIKQLQVEEQIVKQYMGL